MINRVTRRPAMASTSDGDNTEKNLSVGSALLPPFANDANAKMQSEEIFCMAIEACPVGIVMIDHAGNIVLVNTEMERLFGYARDEMLGQTVDILLPANLRARHAEHRGQFAAHPSSRTATGRNLAGRRKDGTEFPIEVGLNPIQTRGGSLVLGVIVDLSERNRIERLKDEFVATVSHELRTPLTSIAGALGLLVGNAGGTLPSPAVRLITIAHANSQRLVRLVNSILEMEKIESGKVVFVLERVEVRALVVQAIEANRGFAEGYGVRIRLDAASEAGEMRGDPDWLVQVVTNLLSNAIKFSPPDEEVVVAIEKRGGNIRISVRDHGHGVPDSFKARIFEKFAQADASDARINGGTGLGLSIVKQIVTRLGGTVDFGDAPGGGAIFHVELPCWEPAAEPESAVA
jgi:PAS domain S-box-containing protein